MRHKLKSNDIDCYADRQESFTWDSNREWVFAGDHMTS